MNDNKILIDMHDISNTKRVSRLEIAHYTIFVEDLKETDCNVFYFLLCYQTVILVESNALTNINGVEISMWEKQKLEHGNSTLRFLLRKMTHTTSRKK